MSKFYNRISIFLLVLFCILSIDSSAQNAEPKFEGITLTDARGKKLHFSSLPRRIAIAGKASYMLADAVYMFPNALPKIVGLPKEARGSEVLLAALDADYENKMKFGLEAGPEQIAAAKPDLVIMKKAGTEQLERSLETLNIPVVCLNLETAEQYERDIAVLGVILGESARAREIQSFMKNRLEAVERPLAALSEAGRPRALLLYCSVKDGMTAFNVAPASWIQTFLIEKAGGRAIWKEAALGAGWTKIGFEQIAAWDPDCIFIVSYFADYKTVKEAMSADSNWQKLRAVKENKVWTFPKDLIGWDQPDPRWLLGLRWLAVKLHPELFQPVSWTNEIIEFFKEFYRADEKIVKEVILPKLTGDL